MVVRPLFRAILLIALCVAPMLRAGASVLSESDRQTYRAAFAAIRNSDWSGAEAKARQAKDPILAKAVRFFDLARANPGVRFADITAFITENPDWPSQATLRQRAEEAIATVGDEELALWFERFPPITPFAPPARGGYAARPRRHRARRRGDPPGLDHQANSAPSTRRACCRNTAATSAARTR